MGPPLEDLHLKEKIPTPEALPSGLNSEAGHACWERAGSARLAPREPHNLSELLIAESRRLQWERIAALMAREGPATYAPARDARRYEQQRLQRLVDDVAEAERSGAGTVQIETSRDPP